MKLDPLDVVLCTSARLRKASRALSQMYDIVLKPSGLKGTQFTLLATLDKTGALPISKLAEVLGMERTTLTRNLKHMIDKGYVEDDLDSDQRIRLIRITLMGRGALNEAMPLWGQAQARAVESLGQADWALLMNSAEKIAKKIKGE